MLINSTPNKPVSFHISPIRIAVFLTAVVAFLGMAHLVLYFSPPGVFSDALHTLDLYRFFDLGSEANLPTFISSLNLLLAGGLLTIIAFRESRIKTKFGWQWGILAIGFIVMGFDEAAQIHEAVVGDTLLKYMGRGEGVLYYRWYMIYIPLVLMIGILYIPFLKRLPNFYIMRFLISGVIFVGGAIGMEMVEAYMNYNNHSGIGLSKFFEETCEMMGVVIFIHTLLHYLQKESTSIQIFFAPQKEQNQAFEVPLKKVESEKIFTEQEQKVKA